MHLNSVNRANRDFWLLAGPMIISNVSIALLGLVDTAVVGHLDSAVYLGGVAVGSIVFDFLFMGMGFLRMGTTGIVAQANGKGDAREIRTILAQSVLISLAIAALILIFQATIIKTGLALLDGSAKVKYYADIYCQWMIWGVPAVMLIFSIHGWLLGMQNAIATLKLAMLINVLNIVLDIVFVVGLDMDVRGVALASVISHYTGVVAGFSIITRKLRHYPGTWLTRHILNPGRIKTFLSFNKDIFIRTICLITVFAFFTRESARHGDLILAANSILMKFYMLIAMAMDGFNNAAEAMVGMAIGARNRAMFDMAMSLALRWSLVFGLCFTALYWLCGDVLIAMLTDITKVRELAETYLPWLILLPIVSIWCFLLDGVFIGATRGPEMRNSMLVCVFIFFLPLWYTFRFFGNHGLWLAFTLFIIARGLTLGFCYYRIEKTIRFVQ